MVNEPQSTTPQHDAPAPHAPGWRRLALIALALVLIGAIGAGAVALVNQANQARDRSAARDAAAQATLTAQEATTQAQTNGAQYEISALSMDSPTDGWALAITSSGPGAPALLHISDGVAVRQTTMPLGVIGGAVLQALSPTDLWEAPISGSSSIGRYDGHTWTHYPLPIPPDADSNVTGVGLEMFQMRSPTDGWAIAAYSVPASAGSPSGIPPSKLAFYHYDGSAWRLDHASASASAGAMSEPQRPDDMAPILITGMSISPGGDVWATGVARFAAVQTSGDVAAYGLIYHRVGGVWSVQRMGDRELTGVAMTGAASGWIIGAADQIIKVGSNPDTFNVNQSPLALRWDGANWAPVTLPASSAPQAAIRLSQVVAASPTDVWIAGLPTSAGYTPGAPNANNTDELMHFDGTRWSVASEPQVAAINPAHDTSAGNVVSFPALAAPAPGLLWLAGNQTVIQGGGQTAYPLIYFGSAGHWTRVAMPAF